MQETARKIWASLSRVAEAISKSGQTGGIYGLFETAGNTLLARADVRLGSRTHLGVAPGKDQPRCGPRIIADQRG